MPLSYGTRVRFEDPNNSDDGPMNLFNGIFVSSNHNNTVNVRLDDGDLRLYTVPRDKVYATNIVLPPISIDSLALFVEEDGDQIQLGTIERCDSISATVRHEGLTQTIPRANVWEVDDDTPGQFIGFEAEEAAREYLQSDDEMEEDSDGGEPEHQVNNNNVNIVHGMDQMVNDSRAEMGEDISLFDNIGDGTGGGGGGSNNPTNNNMHTMSQLTMGSTESIESSEWDLLDEFNQYQCVNLFEAVQKYTTAVNEVVGDEFPVLEADEISNATYAKLLRDRSAEHIKKVGSALAGRIRLDPGNEDIIRENPVLESSVLGRYIEYSLIQAVADVTGITIWCYDKKSHARAITTPDETKYPGSMIVMCDLIDAAEELNELEPIDEVRENIEIMNEDSEDSDGNYSDIASNQSDMDIEMDPDIVVQDVELNEPQYILPIQIEKWETEYNVSITPHSDPLSIYYMITFRGEDEAVELAADNIIKMCGGELKSRYKEKNQATQYTLLFHQLSKLNTVFDTIMPEQSEYVKNKFWKQKHSTTRPRIPVKQHQLAAYKILVKCSNSRGGQFTAFPITSSDDDRENFTRKEGLVAISRAYDALGDPDQEGGVKFSSPFTLSKTKEEVRDLLAEHGFFVGRNAFSREERGERFKFMGYASEYDWADTTQIDTSRAATKDRNEKFTNLKSEVMRKVEIWSKKYDKPRPAERSANSTHPADVFDTEPNVQNILDTKMGDTKHGGSPLWHTSYSSILDGSFWYFNKHHVENLPPAKQFWAPWPTWNATLTHPKRVQVNKCQGMPSVTPNRLFPDEFKGVPCNPHLQPPEYDERSAWAHVSASASVLFHQFHNFTRYNLYGRLGAPYGDQADLYKLAPNDTTHVTMHHWAAGGQPLGLTDLPLPVRTAWKLCFDDPLNPDLANATIKKYWDNYNFCRLEIVDLGDIQ